MIFQNKELAEFEFKNKELAEVDQRKLGTSKFEDQFTPLAARAKSRELRPSEPSDVNKNFPREFCHSILGIGGKKHSPVGIHLAFDQGRD